MVTFFLCAAMQMDQFKTAMDFSGTSLLQERGDMWRDATCADDFYFDAAPITCLKSCTHENKAGFGADAECVLTTRLEYVCRPTRWRHFFPFVVHDELLVDFGEAEHESICRLTETLKLT